ncbi:MAG: hypothetical protein RLZZ399_456 [Verrucomicrobiota bacterium]|jgi:hypothetical protein
MSIHSPALLEKFLETRGYASRISGDSVVFPLGMGEDSYTVAFAFGGGQLSITCQLALLGDFPEERLPSLSLAALDANMQVSPYAFAVIGAAEGEADLEGCPLVLTDTLPLSDLSEAELDFALDKLFEAIALSRDVLQLGLAPKGA